MWTERTAGQHLGGENGEAMILKSGTRQGNKLFVMNEELKCSKGICAGRDG